MDGSATLLVASEEFVREGARRTLGAAGWSGPLIEASTPAEAEAAFLAAAPDLIVATARLAGASTVPLLSNFVERRPDLALIVLAERFEPGEFAAVFRLGAHGYIVVEEGASRGLSLCLAALDGNAVVTSRSALRAFFACTSPATVIPEPRVELNDVERRVLADLVDGRSRADIARTHALSERSLDRIVHRLYEKLGVEGPVQLGAKAVRLALLDDGP